MTWVALAFAVGAAVGVWFHWSVFKWRYQQLVNQRARSLDAIAAVLRTLEQGRAPSKPSSWFGERLDAVDADIRKDAIGFYEALTGQTPPPNMVCGVCNRHFAVHIKGKPCPYRAGKP